MEIVRRILAHIDAGTTDEGDAWREPVENYLDPTRFTAELEMLRSFPASTYRRRRYPTLATMPNASPSGSRCSRSAAATAGRECSATPAATAGWPSSKARAVHTRWCAAITAGLIASTARCRTSPTPTPSPTSTCPPAGLVEVDSREVDGLIVIGPLQSPTIATRQADVAMAALADGSPWRDKLLPAERLVARTTHSRGR